MTNKKFANQLLVESLKSSPFYSAHILVDSKISHLADDSFVLLYRAKEYTPSGKIIKFSPIGYARADIVRAKLAKKPFPTPVYSEKSATKRILLQKTQDSAGNDSYLYLLPIENNNFEPVGGYLFRKTITTNTAQVSFCGSVSQKRCDVLKKIGVDSERFDNLQAPFSPGSAYLAPMTTIPLAGTHYEPVRRYGNDILRKTLSRIAANGHHL